jgi:hypothetical protein
MSCEDVTQAQLVDEAASMAIFDFLIGRNWLRYGHRQHVADTTSRVISLVAA